MVTTRRVACIFRSTRSNGGTDYESWSQRMDSLVSSAPGYVDHFSFRDPVTREGVTISYFVDLESVEAWRVNAEHAEAQRRGRIDFYDEYSVQVVEIVRDYQWRRDGLS